MNPNTIAVQNLYVHHVASGKTRRVCFVRTLVDGTRVFQLFQCIKFGGDTIYQVDASECLA